MEEVRGGGGGACTVESFDGNVSLSSRGGTTRKGGPSLPFPSTTIDE